MVSDVIYDGECKVVLSEDNIVMLFLSTLEQSFRKTAFSMIIVSTLSGADKGFSKSKALFEIFRVDGFSLICCKPGLTGLVGLFFDLCQLVTLMNPELGPLFLLIVHLILLCAGFRLASVRPPNKDYMKRTHKYILKR